MTTRKVAVAATEPVLEAFLASVEGTAVDTVVMGVMAAAAHHPSTLLGPVVFMVGGAGVGTKWVDGRVRQPGLGVARPRGFTDKVPDAAFVGSPRLPAAIAATLAAFGSVTPTRAATTVARWAKGHSAARAALVERIGRVGNLALTERKEALLMSLGKAAGGLLSEEDLDGGVETYVAHAEELPGGWSAYRADLPSEASSHVVAHAVVAADARGTIAIGVYSTSEHGVAVAELDLVAPRVAAPVLRGEVRRTPGTPCAFNIECALASPPGHAVSVALASAGASLEPALSRLSSSTIAEALHGVARGVCAHILTPARPQVLRA
jgi:hypothetical protein